MNRFDLPLGMLRIGRKASGLFSAKINGLMFGMKMSEPIENISSQPMSYVSARAWCIHTTTEFS